MLLPFFLGSVLKESFFLADFIMHTIAMKIKINKAPPKPAARPITTEVKAENKG